MRDILVTTDEELNLLDQQLRRLKIEYEIFFNNPAKRPPTDIEWKVNSLLRKLSEGVRMNMSQRYRYNEMAQRYAVQSDLWRKKMRIREEGYRRPQDAILSVQGVRGSEEREAKHHIAYGVKRTSDKSQEQIAAGQTLAIQSGDDSERSQIETLYKALSDAKQKSGEKVSGDVNSFAAFVQKKTSELRRKHGCEAVEYSIEIQAGQAKLKAKAKV